MSDYAQHYRTKNDKNTKQTFEKCDPKDEENTRKFLGAKQNVDSNKCLLLNVGSNDVKNVCKSNNKKNYVMSDNDCFFDENDEGEGRNDHKFFEEVFRTAKNSVSELKKNRKPKSKRKNVARQDSSTADDLVEDLDDGFTGEGQNPRKYSESTSIDSGIECENNHVQDIDHTFNEFLMNGHDDSFLDPDTHYVCPKYTCNRIDNVLAFTLHAKNVSSDSIKWENLSKIGAARVKFYSTSQQHIVQHYAFFVKMSHSNANNNTAAIITDVSAESWDNNVVFQVDLDQKIGVAIEEYRSGIDQYHLSTQPTNIKVLSSIPEPRNGEQDNDTLTIEVENSSGNEINIAIKSKNVDDHFISNNNNTILSAKRRLKKKKNRSYSESHCDELKVISESECLSNTEDPTRNINVPNHKETARKTRSISESYQDVCHSESDHHNLKYKSILKYSYDRSVSFGSSVDELFFSASLDFGGSTDPELSESCKKSVRFSEHITRQLYR